MTHTITRCTVLKRAAFGTAAAGVFGIGDYPYCELGCPTNEAVVARAASEVRGAGREIASPADMLDMPAAI